MCQLRLKSSAERVALLGGEALEESALDDRLQRLTRNMRVLILQYFRLELVTALRGVGGSFCGLALAAFMLAFSGSTEVANSRFIDVGDLATGLGYFRLFSTACQGLPEKLPMVSTMAGLSERVVALWDALQDTVVELEAEEAEGEARVWGAAPAADGRSGGSASEVGDGGAFEVRARLPRPAPRLQHPPACPPNHLPHLLLADHPPPPPPPPPSLPRDRRVAAAWPPRGRRWCATSPSRHLPSRPIPSHPVPSRPVPSRPVPSRPRCATSPSRRLPSRRWRARHPSPAASSPGPSRSASPRGRGWSFEAPRAAESRRSYARSSACGPQTAARCAGRLQRGPGGCSCSRSGRTCARAR